MAPPPYICLDLSCNCLWSRNKWGRQGDGSVKVVSIAPKYGIMRLFIAGFEKFDDPDQSLFRRVLNDE